MAATMTMGHSLAGKTLPKASAKVTRTPVPVASRVRCQAKGYDNKQLQKLVSSTPFDNFKFAPVKEAVVNRAMTRRYFKVGSGLFSILSISACPPRVPAT